jgi:hypothetical protein
MSISVTINPRTNVISKVTQKKTTVSSVNIGPKPSLTLDQITNVDASDPDDGEALIFDAALNEYVIKPITINSNNITNIAGGTF